MPFAEQVVWRMKHPGPGAPLHTVESFALTDILLKLVLTSGVRVGATVKLMGRKFEFLLWRWSDAWDLGSTQKAKFQPGLEASYLDECHGATGAVTNHQAGPGSPLACTGGDALVCRYPSSSSPGWSGYDQPSELISYCKDKLAQDVEDPPAPTLDDFAATIGDTLNFGLDVGTTAWNEHPLCVGGQLVTDWAKNPPQMSGACRYFGGTAGAAATFPCTDLGRFTLETWGCLDATTALGGQVAAMLASHGLSQGYVLSPAYPSSTSGPAVFDLEALISDTSAPSATAALAPAVQATLNGPADELLLRRFLASVEQCYATHFQDESACGCTTSVDCLEEVGELCRSGQCVESSGALAACPFVAFDDHPQPAPCCGDGQVETSAGEACDDGNIVDADGCSSSCRPETGPAACCTPTGCVDMDWSLAARCAVLKGNLMGGTCVSLSHCGQVSQGSCVGTDGLCHQPMTAEQCRRIKGTYRNVPCAQAP